VLLFVQIRKAMRYNYKCFWFVLENLALVIFKGAVRLHGNL